MPLRMLRTSRKPSVVNNAVVAPVRVNNALVATVLPCIIIKVFLRRPASVKPMSLAMNSSPEKREPERSLGSARVLWKRLPS